MLPIRAGRLTKLAGTAGAIAVGFRKLHLIGSPVNPRVIKASL